MRLVSFGTSSKLQKIISLTICFYVVESGCQLRRAQPAICLSQEVSKNQDNYFASLMFLIHTEQMTFLWEGDLSICFDIQVQNSQLGYLALIFSWVLFSTSYIIFLCYDRLGFGNLNGSLEQVQVDLFEKQILGGSKLSIFQYAMVLFWHDKHEGLLQSIILVYDCCLFKNKWLHDNTEG